MIKILNLLLAIICLIGCDLNIKRVKEAEKQEKILDDPFLGGGSTNRIFTIEELEVAKSACSALFNKISKFKTILLGTNFSFHIKENSCPPEISRQGRALLNLNLENGILKFSLVNEYNGAYLREVYTSEDGDLRYFCPSILSGERINNSHELNLTNKIVLAVKNGGAGGLEPELSLSYFTQKKGSTYVLEKKINLKVDASVSEYEGNIIDFELKELCPDQKKFSQINQTFVFTP